MVSPTRFLLAATMLFASAVTIPVVQAQEPKRGGIFRVVQNDNPPSASIYESASISVAAPFMAVYNNLVMFDTKVDRDRMDAIVPELATEWSWSGDGKALTFKLRSGVKWHDGKAFTSADVKCTMDLVKGLREDKLRINPRRSWYENVQETVTNGDFEVTFKLGWAQPSLLGMFASGLSPIYPCHVNAATMRTHPIGTGPFRFVEMRQNEIIRLARNPDYWKPRQPYLDGIERPIITSRATATLAFLAGRVDMTFPYTVTPAILTDIEAKAPQSVCRIGPTNTNGNLLLNRDKAPFDNPDLRRAMALTINRKAFNDILFEGTGKIGGAMLPAPEGVWGMPKSILQSIAGYGPDVAKNRAEARALMEKHGYGPNKRLAMKITTRNLPTWRDMAVILIDHLREIYVDGELEIIETAAWYGKVTRKDYTIGLNTTGNGIDDPDQNFFEHYACKSERNVTGYCNPELEKMLVAQSQETDLEKRKQMVWEIDRQLQEDLARPVIVHNVAGTCWHPAVIGINPALNAIYNRHRYDDVWLNR